MINIHDLLARMAEDPFMMVPHYEVTELAREVANYRSAPIVGYLVSSPNLITPHFVKDESSARRLAAIAGVNVQVLELTPRRTIVCNVLDEKENHPQFLELLP